ncbi:hypothetical protein H257_06243 [Aphanomyces astaci]|uniref:Uncharacterized protein n=1 Tax=Aphanomyces astaci TaxID=112090 RepID=W4GM27_APHAT|nr:hypothetical protein H257_06243 [Aphanomyces astaci]ETV80755.1 hypothetical protein H257_06243 [Aphanomyces astaci]|eukprot:XP_009829702.1 hypothetical protein H257_06243 [Aphanomyces astaci]
MFVCDGAQKERPPSDKWRHRSPSRRHVLSVMTQHSNEWELAVAPLSTESKANSQNLCETGSALQNVSMRWCVVYL